MRFLRGIGVGVLGLFLLFVVSSLGFLALIYEYRLYQDYDASYVWLFLGVLLMASFAIMVGGPLYYWVIEPIRDKYHSRQQYFSGAQSHPRSPSGQVASFCSECGTQNRQQAKLCPNCGVNLVQH